MTKASIDLQDLRRRLYAKAKAEPSWRFWGLYVHVCKRETLWTAYGDAKRNQGAPGSDGETFEAIEAHGVEPFLEALRQELVTGTYRPRPVRRTEIPKGPGKTRTLSIPAIRDRVVQGALKLILEPIFEADFQDGSFGYRPHRQAHQALARVGKAIVQGKTTVIDLDLKSFFDNVRHHLVLEKVARRVNDDDVLRLLKHILKATGRRGVAQGGVISPLLSNLYLTEVDTMLEKAKAVTAARGFTHVEYARFADDLVVLVDGHSRQSWLGPALQKRLKEELDRLGVEINPDKSRCVDLTQGGSFGFLGFQFRRVRSRQGKWFAHFIPAMKKRTALLSRLREQFQKRRSQPVSWVIQEINPILRGWTNYFRMGHASRCFAFVREWVEKAVRRHLMRNQKRRGCGWHRWSSAWLYEHLGLYADYQVRYRYTA
jgi:RNA-directed DNA polymerase